MSAVVSKFNRLAIVFVPPLTVTVAVPECRPSARLPPESV